MYRIYLRRRLLCLFSLVFGFHLGSFWMTEKHGTGSYHKAPRENNRTNSTTTVERLTPEESSTDNLFVFTAGKGRFGSRLFQYASVLGIAAHNKRKAVYGRKMLVLKDVFPRLEISVIDDPPDSWLFIQRKVTWDFEERMFSLPDKNVTLKGPLRSFRYFEEISSWFYKDILSHINITFLSKATNFIKAAKEHYGKQNFDIVPKSICVHVRRGDKATSFSHEKLLFRLPTKDDIYHAMDYMEETFKHVVFIVASDTRQWCEQHLRGRNVYISNLTTFYEDFVLMSNCDHMIMTVGTFGWWASWMTSQRGGTSMYYNHPYVPGSRKDKALNKHNSFPSSWIAYNSSTIIKHTKS